VPWRKKKRLGIQRDMIKKTTARERMNVSTKPKRAWRARRSDVSLGMRLAEVIWPAIEPKRLKKSRLSRAAEIFG